MSSPPVVTPLPPGLWQPVQRAPMMLAYTLVKVGASVSQVTTSEAEPLDVQAGALGPALTVSVTISGVAGQVKTGVALAGLSKLPAVAVQVKVGADAPAEAVADS